MSLPTPDGMVEMALNSKSAASDFVMSLDDPLHGMGFDEDDRADIRLGVSEALGIAFDQWGIKERREVTVRYWTRLVEEQFQIRIAPDGRGYPVAEFLKPPRDEDPLLGLALQVALIKHSMHSVQFLDDGRVLELRRRLH